MFEEAFVFGGEHCIYECRRNLIEWRPRAAAHFVVGADVMDGRAIAVEDDAFAGGVVSAEVLVDWRCCCEYRIRKKR